LTEGDFLPVCDYGNRIEFDGNAGGVLNSQQGPRKNDDLENSMGHQFLQERQGIVAALASAFFAPAWAANQPDYQVEYAIQSELATSALLLGITEAGDRLVTVGEYGHILYSDDRGETWVQAENVPTRITLTAVSFANDQEGWAVGHDAVILHTSDGGTTWERQYTDPVLEGEIDPGSPLGRLVRHWNPSMAGKRGSIACLSFLKKLMTHTIFQRSTT
jgi:hypothetical protein